MTRPSSCRRREGTAIAVNAASVSLLLILLCCVRLDLCVVEAAVGERRRLTIKFCQKCSRKGRISPRMWKKCRKNCPRASLGGAPSDDEETPTPEPSPLPLDCSPPRISCQKNYQVSVPADQQLQQLLDAGDIMPVWTSARAPCGVRGWNFIKQYVVDIQDDTIYTVVAKIKDNHGNIATCAASVEVKMTTCRKCRSGAAKRKKKNKKRY